jgi:hypothetical protein
VLAEGNLYGDRVWFHDTRSPARRMGVSSHPFDATVVISLWQGDCCTGTFRLPVADAARLISTLAYGMAEGLPEDRGGTAGEPTVRRRWWGLLRRMLRPVSAHPGSSHLRLLKRRGAGFSAPSVHAITSRRGRVRIA